MTDLNDPEIILQRLLYDRTVSDCKLIDKKYEKLRQLWSELDDHDRNGRTRDSNKVFTEIIKINREITVTENRCRGRLGLKKL